MTPAELALLDQTGEALREHMAVFGVDLRDPATLAAVVGTAQFLTATFHHCPGIDRDGILRGFLFGVTTMQEGRP